VVLNKSRACSCTTHIHVNILQTYIKKEYFTAGWLAQQNIKMKRLKRKNEKDIYIYINVEVIRLLMDKYCIY